MNDDDCCVQLHIFYAIPVGYQYCQHCVLFSNESPGFFYFRTGNLGNSASGMIYWFPIDKRRLIRCVVIIIRWLVVCVGGNIDFLCYLFSLNRWDTSIVSIPYSWISRINYRAIVSLGNCIKITMIVAATFLWTTTTTARMGERGWLDFCLCISRWKCSFNITKCSQLGHEYTAN